MITLYDSKFSGNGWKVRLLLSMLDLPFERKVLMLADGAARTPEFLQLNPLARVPVLVLADGTALYESNAILLYLANGSAFLPATPLEQSRVHQWLFFEQFDHVRFFARPRFLVSLAKVADQHADEIAYLRQIGQKALPVLQAQLDRTPWLCGAQCTVADIALFPYTSMAEMGGYDLQPFPAIRAWAERFRALPGFIPLVAD